MNDLGQHKVERSTLIFFVNGKKVGEVLLSIQKLHYKDRCYRFVVFQNTIEVVDSSPEPEETLLSYLRQKLRLTGTKLGCGEGGCGACTVMISHWDQQANKINFSWCDIWAGLDEHKIDIRAVLYFSSNRHMSVNACLAPVVSVHGCAVTTVEGIGSTKTKLHAVQERLSKFHGSQCGFCTPGIVMSMYALLRNKTAPSEDEIETCLQGNLCRCTGYRPIISAFRTFTDKRSGCPMGEKCCRNQKPSSCDQNNDSKGCSKSITDRDPHSADDLCFSRYDPSQEIIFPPELLINSKKEVFSQPLTFVGERVTWFRPTSLDQLTELRGKYPDAQLVNGNTEVGVETGVKGRCFPVIIAPTGVKSLQMITVGEEGIDIGSCCTLSNLQEELGALIRSSDPHRVQWMQATLDMLLLFAGDQIRNVAAIGGNVMTASPISDLNPILMANESVARFRLDGRGDRRAKMDEHFFPKYRSTCAQRGELLLSIHVPFNKKNEYFRAFKQSKRRDDDIAIVNAAMRVVFHPGSCKVEKFVSAFGGMAATTAMPLNTMRNMAGRMWDEDLLEDFQRWIAEDFALPLNAPGGMVEYREALVVGFFFKFFLHVKNSLIRDGIVEGNVCDEDKSAICEEQHKGSALGTQTWQEVPADQDPEDIVGRPVKHFSGDKHVTGEAIYVDDMSPYRDELFLGLVLSIRAHARIVDVDVSKAMTSPGFVTYVDHRDVTGSNDVPTAGVADDPAFAKDKVSCVGQVIGAVVADSQAHAQRAAMLVNVQYQDIEPLIITIQDAIKRQSFFKPTLKVCQGDVENTWNDCDHVVEGEVSISGQEHFYLETQACLVVPLLEDGSMEIFASCQDPTALQLLVASVLGVDHNKIMTRVKRMGGGFGGKETRFVLIACPAAVAAQKCGRPVRCMLSRKEDMTMTGGRHPFYAKYKVGFMNDGKVKSLKVELFSNAGNSTDLSIPVLKKALMSSDNCYHIPNMKVEGTACRTNIASNTAFRGFGSPQAMFVAESWITRISDHLGIPPEKVRAVNLYKSGQVTHYNGPVETNNGRRCWEECLDKSDFHQRKLAVQEFNKNNRWRKQGIACIPTKYAIGIIEYKCQAGALVNIYSDGSVYLTHGGTEMGQGLHTKMTQIAGRCFGIPVDRIYISETSTSTVPNTSATAASMGTDLNGMAVKDACEKIMVRLAPLRDEFPDFTWNQLIEKAYVSRISLSATGFYKVPEMYREWDLETGLVKGRMANYFTYGAAVCQVEIDSLTGDHVIVQTDIVMDLGKSLNPAIDIGQIEGAFTQGYGLFTMEQPLHTPSGHPLTTGPGAYKIPGFGDCPKQFNVHLLRDSSNNRAIYSSKGVGEPPFFLASSAFFAIRDAVAAARKDSGLFGNFRFDSPATAERIRMACGDQFTKQHRRHATQEEDEKLAPCSISV